ncbi:hypothetical protein C8J57DRAFT_1359677 [Mycena rebaudengoi]|nr:hypothetical protein C8J57DRAFT_1359677 [Mycena rebaudengoi]
MPIGVQREKTKKKQSREQEREVGRGKRVGRQKRDEDDLKTEAVLVANKADWVEELNGEGERITRLMFDVDVDGADRAASENLELAACAEWELAWAKGLVAPEKMGLGKERPQTCLVVPRPLDPGFVSDYYAGGEVRGRYEVSEETSGKLAQNGKATSGDKGKPKRNPTNAAKPKPRPLPRRAPSLVVPTSAGPRAAPPRRDDQVSTPSTSSRGLLLPAPSTAAKPRRRTPSPEPVPETPQTEDEDPMDVGEEVIVPMSMKALGKQKAPNRSPTPPLCDHEMNAFYQIPDKPPPQQQFYVSPQSLHYPLSAPVPPAPNHATSVQPMSTYFSALDHEPYGNGTIDPALLGGGIMEPLVDYASSVASSSPSPPASPPPASAPAPAAFATARTPTRRPVHRPGMVRTDLLDLDDDDDDGYSSSSSSLSSASSEFKVNFKSRTPPPEPQQSVAVLKPAVSAPTPKKNPQTKVNPETTAISNDPFFRYSGPPWPKGGRELFCHQCRSKKDVLIMACPCARNFCVSCVMRRYDPGVVEFRLDPPLGLCPMCRDICTCDKCTTNRGEVYVSRRLSRSGPRFARPLMPRRGAAPRVQTPRVPAAPRLPRRAPLPSLNQVIVPTTYHGIIYDLNGNPISSAYLGADGNTAVVVTRPIPRRRVFVGAVQDSWNLGPNPPVYVDAVPVKKPPLKNGRQRKIRYYIGDKDLLFQSVRPLPASRTSVAAIPDAPVEPTIPDDSVVAISDSSVETDIHNPVAAEIPNDSVVAIRDSSIDDDPVAAEIPDDPVAVPDEPMAQIPNPVAAIPHVAAVISRASSPLSSLGDIEGED